MILSHTSLSTFFQCGERYRFRYEEKIKFPPTPKVIRGRAVDASIDANLRTKIEHGQFIERGDVAEIVLSATERIIAEEGITLTEEEASRGMKHIKDEMVFTGRRLAFVHHSLVAPQLTPTHVQREFDIPVGSHKLIGSIDIQEGNRSVRDTKVRDREPAKDEADTSLQLSVYAMAVAHLDGQIPAKVALDVLIDREEYPYRKRESTRARHQFIIVEDRVDAAARAIQAGVFVPADPKDWRCSRAYCPYWEMCRYAVR